MKRNKNVSRSSVKGIGFLFLSLLIISVQNVAVKGLGGSYPVLEMVVIRTLVALPLALVFCRMEGIKGFPKTSRLKLHLLRGLFLFLSFTTYMMGLVALPLGQVESIRYSGPLMITVLSAIILREKVELHRWLFLVVGFIGMIFIIRPGSAQFNSGTVFILLSVFFYALTVLCTRRLQTTESSAIMAFYGSLVYLLAALVLIPVTIMVGEVPDAQASIAFLLDSWSVPSLQDGLIMAGLGLLWAVWIYLSARAYSLAKASVLASFEYFSLPINILLGFLFWREIPLWTTLGGAALIIVSGMSVLFLDRRKTALTESPFRVK